MTTEQELEVVQQLKESGEKMAILRKEYAPFCEQVLAKCLEDLSTDHDRVCARQIAWAAFKFGKGYQAPKFPKVDA